MSAKTHLSNLPRTYSEASERLGQETWRKVAHNTWVVRHDDHSLGLVLHDTEVVNFEPDGAILLDSGGWRTVTTKDRINRVIRHHGYNLFSEARHWKVTDPTGIVHDFFDGFDIPAPRADLLGTHCECGAPYDPNLRAYACAR